MPQEVNNLDQREIEQSTNRYQNPEEKREIRQNVTNRCDTDFSA